MSLHKKLRECADKHSVGEQGDKAGWVRLVRGAVAKAVYVFWASGGALDVTLGEDASLASPPRDPSSPSIYFSPSCDEIMSPREEEGTFSEYWSPVASPPGGNSTPKARATPQRKEPPLGQTLQAAPGESFSSQLESDPDYITMEVERLSLRKLISEAEKDVMHNIKEEFDKRRKAFEDHDKEMRDLLERETAEREVEQKLKELQEEEETQHLMLSLQQTFNSNLLSILSKSIPPTGVEQDRSGHEEQNTPKNLEQEKVKAREAVAEQVTLVNTFIQLQKEYNTKYEIFLEILHSVFGDKTKKVPLNTEFSNQLKTLKSSSSVFVRIMNDKSKVKTLKESDIEMCTNALKFLEVLIKKVHEMSVEIEQKKLEEISHKEIEEELKKKVSPERETPLRIDPGNPPAKEKNSVERRLAEQVLSPVKEENTLEIQSAERDFSPVKEESSFEKRLTDRDQYYKYVSDYLEATEKSLEHFINNNNYKAFRKNCLMAVNAPVNAISPTSSSHLLDKLNKLTNLLDGREVPLPGKKFSAASHNCGIKYVTVLLARKIVKIGEDVISSHPETAYAVASVTASLIMKYPKFTILLFAYFYRVCPYLIPKYWDKQPNETIIQYNKRLGFLYNENEREDTDKFLKRMSGVTQLFGALLITPRRRADACKPYPLGVAEVWQWITVFISLDPQPDISATLLLDMLEVTGHYMLESYGFTFQKLLYLICTHYINRIDEVTPAGRGGPVQRLKTFLQDVIKVQRIPSPKGILPSNFW